MNPELYTSSTPEVTPPQEALSDLETVANKLQLLLMPLAYQEHHPGITLDLTNSILRQEMASEWVDHHAEAFRDYIETHPHETIDLGDSEALSAFLENLSPDSSTLH